MELSTRRHSRLLPAILATSGFAVLATGTAAVLFWLRLDAAVIDARDPAQVALGTTVYADQCAVCHGAGLAGQPNWQARLPSGLLPAPPHDATGHTWHHADGILFGITKGGLVPPYAPEGYDSAMPAFGPELTDEQIRAVLAFIKSTWPPRILERQESVTRQSEQ